MRACQITCSHEGEDSHQCDPWLEARGRGKGFRALHCRRVLSTDHDGLVRRSRPATLLRGHRVRVHRAHEPAIRDALSEQQVTVPRCRVSLFAVCDAGADTTNALRVVTTIFHLREL